MSAAVLDASELELVLRVRSGDDQAGQALLERHRDAVAALPPSTAFRSVEASGRHALAYVRRGTDGELPFRAVWLGLHATGRVPTGADGVVWSAFAGLPSAWRTALWHREVEGQRTRTIAAHLDMSEEQAHRALVSAYAALKRRVALAHPDAGASGLCADVLDTYRFSAPATLPAAEVRALREHGRHCDDCLGLIRDLFLVEHTLRAALAAAVLGPVADTYLALRPVAPRLRTPSAEVVHSERRFRPVLATVSAGFVGAAAMALALANPAISPADDTSRGIYAGDVPAPGRTFWPAVDALVSHGSEAVAPARPTPVAADAATDGASEGGDGRGPGAEGPAGEPAGPGSPTEPTAPTEPDAPTQPGEPGEPGEEPGGPDGPDADPPGEAGISVDVDVDTDSVGASLDPNTSTPEEIEIEIPIDEDDVEDAVGSVTQPVTGVLGSGRLVR